MNCSIETKKLCVIIQQNGIIRNQKGLLIGKLIREIDFQKLENDNRIYKLETEAKENISEIWDLYNKIETLIGYLEAIIKGRYNPPFWQEIPDVIKECNDFLKDNEHKFKRTVTKL